MYTGVCEKSAVACSKKAQYFQRKFWADWWM